jgi:pimeloyl-ACP methyl ester carboxylesterase
VSDEHTPAVLVVPGFGDGSGSWEHLLQRRSGVAVVDLPGVGGGAPLASVTLAAMVEHLCDRIVQEVGPVVLIGHSLGSAIAVGAAAELPSVVVGVLSIEGNLTTDDGYFSGAAAEHGDADSFVTWLVALVRGLVAQGDAPRSYLASILQADPTTLWELGRDSALCGRGDGFGAAYRTLRQPTRYLWSRRSTPVTTQQYLRAHGLDARESANAGHWPLERAPRWVTQQVDAFVAAVSGA